MRLLLAADVPPAPRTGMGRWAARVADALAASGHEATVWSSEDLPGTRVAGRFAVATWPAALAARIVRERERFDAVVVHEPGGMWYGLLRRLRPDLPPLVAMCHNAEAKVYGVMREAARRGFARPLPWTWLATPLWRLPHANATLRLAQRVVCLSAEDEAFLTETLRIPRQRVARTPNGVAPEDFVPHLDGPPRDRVLFVGGWIDVKGRRLLPPLWRSLRAERPSATLTLAGTGCSAEAVSREFAVADRDSIAVRPRCDSAELRTLYAGHDVLLVPSLSEGSPLALLEAMAAGTPGVAAAVGGIPDIVSDGVDGWLFPRMDAGAGAARLATALADPDALARVRRTAVERVRAFTWDRVARALAGAAREATG